MEQLDEGSGSEPAWRRIADLPFVAMLIALALYVLAMGVGVALGSLVGALFPSLETAIFVARVIMVAVVVVTYKLAISRLGEHRRDDLPAAGALPGFGFGALLGLLIFSLAVGAAAMADVYNIVGAGSTRQLAHDLVISALVPAFMEEILFRGILFRWIEQFAGSAIALLLTGAFFGLAHLFNPNATLVAALGIAVEAGLLLGAAYMLARNLWLAIGLHAAWNFTQGFIFDIPVSGIPEEGLVTAKLSGPAILSGGGFGLEASLFAMVVATIAGALLLLLAIRRGEWVQPSWQRGRVVISL